MSDFDPTDPAFWREAASTVPTITTEELFAGGSAIVILHGGLEYWLRIQPTGRLVLDRVDRAARRAARHLDSLGVVPPKRDEQM